MFVLVVFGTVTVRLAPQNVHNCLRSEFRSQTTTLCQIKEPNGTKQSFKIFLDFLLAQNLGLFFIKS